MVKYNKWNFFKFYYEKRANNFNCNDVKWFSLFQIYINFKMLNFPSLKKNHDLKFHTFN